MFSYTSQHITDLIFSTIPPRHPLPFLLPYPLPLPLVVGTYVGSCNVKQLPPQIQTRRYIPVLPALELQLMTVCVVKWGTGSTCHNVQCGPWSGGWCTEYLTSCARVLTPASSACNPFACQVASSRPISFQHKPFITGVHCHALVGCAVKGH